ncbi:hypothetical protein N9356_04020 [Porticoccaceae bacterium]|nr:hypothetical protein [Porticoccaceae bacterium]
MKYLHSWDDIILLQRVMNTGSNRGRGHAINVFYVRMAVSS